MSQYIELQTVSNFSFLRGASHPEELMQQAVRLGYSAIALTDWHSLSGIVRAHSAAKDLKLIVGASVRLYEAEITKTIRQQDEPLESLPYNFPDYLLPCSLLLYPTSRQGYSNLCSLLTLGKLNTLKGQCLLALEDLPKHNQGLLAVVVVQQLHHPQLLNILQKLNSIFNADRFSLALSNQYGPGNAKRLNSITQLSSLTNIPLVVTNDVHYHCPTRRELQDVLTCIRKHTTLSQAGLNLFQNAERYLKSPNEMARLFKNYPKALTRTQEIAHAAANFSLDELTYEYPEEVCPKHLSPQVHLTNLAWSNAQKRYPKGIPEKVTKQIEHELQLIGELNYAKYFLTVYDIILFAQSKNILCQGRGAAANSAVCYVLGITAVDPSYINLFFERFISKERNEPPDIDIDFEHERREEVIQYIYAKYGRHRAALTATVITYRSRSAVRDIGKVFDLTEEEIEDVIKLFTRNEEQDFSEKELIKRGIDPNNSKIRHTIELVETLKGFPRHLSQHVGGFIISQEKLSSIVPIENAAMPDRTVIEWDKDDIEKMNMLKIDVLGLGMLSCIRKALALLNDSKQPIPSRPAEHLQLYSIPQDDKKVYEMISAADTIGVFQIESRAQMSMLPRLRPKCFYDLVIEVAIVRPGPIQGGMVHPYLRRRSGLEKAIYPNEKIKQILAPTLGVPIFQEQVMQLSVVAAGFSPGESDQLRRAMASWKRNKNALEQFKLKLINGMLKNGYSKSFAEKVYQQIQGFGEYGFPQSHAASFAHLVYVSSWIKCHYPAVFAAALLNSQPMGFYQPAQIINDARQHGVTILPIDVNHSSWDCTLEPGNSRHSALRLGMRLVSGLRQTQAEIISAAVKTCGRFSSPQALWKNSSVKTSTLKLLAKADAFGSMKLNRQQALWQISKIKDSPLPLFDMQNQNNDILEDAELSEQTLNGLPPFSKKAQVLHDYQTLGFSLKAHPVSFLRTRLSALGVIRCGELKEQEHFPHGTRIAIAGMVLVRQRPHTASGVVFMTIEDETGISNIIVKPKIFAEFRDLLCDSVFLVVTGRVQRVGQVIHVMLESAENLTPAITKTTTGEIASFSRDFH